MAILIYYVVGKHYQAVLLAGESVMNEAGEVKTACGSESPQLRQSLHGFLPTLLSPLQECPLSSH